jgi:hypothetical protein
MIEMTTAQWPETREQWRAVLAAGIGLSPEDGDAQWAAGDLDLATVDDWLATTYAAENGFHPDFVPALARNLRGLLAWVYGGGSEPCWPGRDETA